MFSDLCGVAQKLQRFPVVNVFLVARTDIEIACDVVCMIASLFFIPRKRYIAAVEDVPSIAGTRNNRSAFRRIDSHFRIDKTCDKHALVKPDMGMRCIAADGNLGGCSLFDENTAIGVNPSSGGIGTDAVLNQKLCVVKGGGTIRGREMQLHRCVLGEFIEPECTAAAREMQNRTVLGI